MSAEGKTCYNYMYFHLKKRQNRLFNAASSGVQNIPCFCEIGMDSSPGGTAATWRLAASGYEPYLPLPEWFQRYKG